MFISPIQCCENTAGCTADMWHDGRERVSEREMVDDGGFRTAGTPTII